MPPDERCKPVRASPLGCRTAASVVRLLSHRVKQPNRLQWPAGFVSLLNTVQVNSCLSETGTVVGPTGCDGLDLDRKRRFMSQICGLYLVRGRCDRSRQVAARSSVCCHVSARGVRHCARSRLLQGSVVRTRRIRLVLAAGCHVPSRLCCHRLPCVHRKVGADSVMHRPLAFRIWTPPSTARSDRLGLAGRETCSHLSGA
jgi:hypothetical protein